MAIDTRDKRASAASYVSSVVFPLADSAVSGVDRQHAAWLYRGIAAQVVLTIKSVVIPGGVLVSGRSLEIVAWIRRTAGSSNNALVLKYGGTEVLRFAGHGGDPAWFEAHLSADGSASAQRAYGSRIPQNSTVTGTATVNATEDQTLVLSVEPVKGTDTHVCDYFRVSVEA